MIRPEGSVNWTLQIKYPQTRDSGVYECQINTEPKMSLSYVLNVIGEFTTSGGYYVVGLVIGQRSETLAAETITGTSKTLRPPFFFFYFWASPFSHCCCITSGNLFLSTANASAFSGKNFFEVMHFSLKVEHKFAE